MFAKTEKDLLLTITASQMDHANNNKDQQRQLVF